MIINYIFFGLNVPNWVIGLIGGILLVTAVVTFSYLSVKDQLETENAISKEREEKKKKDLEKGYYAVGSSLDLEKNFYSALNSRLKVIWQVHEKATSDILTISSSWPIGMSEDDLKNFQELIPELISIKSLNEHQLSFKKSPAAYFFSIKENILQHLFNHLNKKYAWVNKEMIISLHCNPLDRLNCHLQVKTSDHIALGIMLGNVLGVINKETTISQMKEKNTYQFDLIKSDNVEWKNLLPKIQEVFKNYFTGGVEFIGPNEI